MTTYWLLGEQKQPEEPQSAESESLVMIDSTANVSNTVVSSPSKAPLPDVALLGNNLPNELNNIEVKNYNSAIPNSSTPLLTNASRDSMV